ncbi:HNH endonuclease [Nakamurella lactea]|uniref:HNH endonuclease n=1 Tax=Nakamurella lactea TaxID=459515 RepID=UPI000684F0F8|nr:HNH endonuclease [Nakamurella lactea]
MVARTAPTAPTAPTAATPESTGPPPDFAPWSPCVALTVAIGASTLAGLDDDPARLAGHGWIHAGLARLLAESASSIRLAINREDATPHQQSPGDPADNRARGQTPAGTRSCTDRPGHQNCTNDATCGGTLDHGRAVYRPPVATKDYVITRDRVCRHPGCRRPAENCDLDHRRPYDQGGPTCPCNLDCLCRSHHRAKTFLGWTAIRTPGNHLRWTTPHGYTATDHPEPQPGGIHFTAADLESQPLYDPAPF